MLSSNTWSMYSREATRNDVFTAEVSGVGRMLDQWFPNSTVSGLGICIWRKQRVRCFDWDSLCPLRFVLCHLGPLRCGTNAGHVSNWCQHSLVKKDLLCYEFRFALWKLSFSSFLRGEILISPLCLSEVWQITFIGCNFFWNNVSYEGDLLQSIFQLVMKLWVFWYR